MPRRAWDRLPDGALFLQERSIDWAEGTISTLHLVVTSKGKRIERRFLLHVYSVKEWVAMLHEAGFADVEAFGGWDSAPPITPEAWRLIIRAR